MTLTVREADRAHSLARRQLSALEESAQRDLSITAAQLVEARAELDLAAGRLEGARKAVAQAEQDRSDALAVRGVAKRRRRDAQARAERLEREQRAIESGKAQRDLTELAELHHSPDAARKLEQIKAWKRSGSTTWPGYDAVEVLA